MDAAPAPITLNKRPAVVGSRLQLQFVQPTTVSGEPMTLSLWLATAPCVSSDRSARHLVLDTSDLKLSPSEACACCGTRLMVSMRARTHSRSVYVLTARRRATINVSRLEPLLLDPRKIGRLLFDAARPAAMRNFTVAAALREYFCERVVIDSTDPHCLALKQLPGDDDVLASSPAVALPAVKHALQELDERPARAPLRRSKSADGAWDEALQQARRMADAEERAKPVSRRARFLAFLRHGRRRASTVTSPEVSPEVSPEA